MASIRYDGPALLTLPTQPPCRTLTGSKDSELVRPTAVSRFGTDGIGFTDISKRAYVAICGRYPLGKPPVQHRRCNQTGAAPHKAVSKVTSCIPIAVNLYAEKIGDRKIEVGRCRGAAPDALLAVKLVLRKTKTHTRALQRGEFVRSCVDSYVPSSSHAAFRRAEDPGGLPGFSGSRAVMCPDLTRYPCAPCNLLDAPGEAVTVSSTRHADRNPDWNVRLERDNPLLLEQTSCALLRERSFLGDTASSASLFMNSHRGRAERASWRVHLGPLPQIPSTLCDFLRVPPQTPPSSALGSFVR